jgi:hypothetical protein
VAESGSSTIGETVSAKQVDEHLRGLEEPKHSTLEVLRRTILEVVYGTDFRGRRGRWVEFALRGPRPDSADPLDRDAHHMAGGRVVHGRELDGGTEVDVGEALQQLGPSTLN